MVLPSPDPLPDVLEDLPSPASATLSGSSVASVPEQDERVCRSPGACLLPECRGGAGSGVGDSRTLVSASAGGRGAGLEDTASCAGGDLDAPAPKRDGALPSLGPSSSAPAASAASACAARAAPSADDACSGAPRRPLAQLRERSSAALPARWRTGGLDAGVFSLGGHSHDSRRAVSAAAAAPARATSRERSPCGRPRAQKENLAEKAPAPDAKFAARARLLFSPAAPAARAAAPVSCALQAVRALQSLQLSHSEAYAVFVRQQVAAAQSALSAAGRALASQEALPVAA